MSEKKWYPDDSFNDTKDGEFVGIREIKEALGKLGKRDMGDKIVTSRDPGIENLTELLRRKNMPEGVEKWMLPVTAGGMKPRHPSFVFVSRIKPGAVVQEHVHKNDNVFRVIVSGSIIQNDVELTSGDWSYIPVGKAYSYTAGKSGALIMHTYH